MATTAASTRQEELGFLGVDGLRTAYADTGGTGTLVVLVHGSWGSHPHWDRVVPGLSEHVLVVTHDRRGHSDSDGHRDRDPSSRTWPTSPVFQPIERQLAQLLPQAERTTYVSAGHIPHVTHPEECRARVVDCIESNEAKRR